MVNVFVILVFKQIFSGVDSIIFKEFVVDIGEQLPSWPNISWGRVAKDSLITVF